MFDRSESVLRVLCVCVLLTFTPATAQDSLECEGWMTLKNFSYIAYIQVSDNSTFCTGVLMDRQWILTAAHCVLPWSRGQNGSRLEAISSSSIVVEADPRGNAPNTRTVASIVLHPDFNANETDRPYKSDLALVRVNVPFEKTAQSVEDPIEIVSDWFMPDKLFCMPLGYGLNSYGGGKRELKCSNMAMFSNLQCKGMDPRYPWHGGQVCGQPVAKCVWDSGGPLVCKTPGNKIRLAGVFSGVASSGRLPPRADWICRNGTVKTNNLMVFTFIHAHSEWLRSTMAPPTQREVVAPGGEAEKETRRRGAHAVSCGGTAKLGDFPYLVLLQMANQPFGMYCTGAILTPSWVVTTAHCLWPPSKGKNLETVSATSIVVKAGLTSRGVEKPFQIRTGEIYDLHPGFDTNPSDETRSRPYENDVALLRVDTPFDFNAVVNAVTLADSGKGLNATPCMALGYGLRANARLFVVHCVNVRAHAVAMCAARIPRYPWQPGKICADAKRKRCYRGSGGPLVCADKQGRIRIVGLINGDPRKLNGDDVRSDKICTSLNDTLVSFTHLDHYADWIRSVIAEPMSPRVYITELANSSSPSKQVLVAMLICLKLVLDLGLQ